MIMKDDIRVMLCDDSSTMRRLIKTVFKKEPRLQVVHEAKNGAEAIDHVASTCPDIIIMDVEMPVMDGVEATREIRKRFPVLPIIMFSSLTSRGAEASLDALSAGANDVVVKPAAAGHINQALSVLAQQLVAKVIALADRNMARRATIKNAPASVVPGATTKPGTVEVIAIGVSTGGPDALAHLLKAVTTILPVPVLITQHMPPIFTKRLASRLESQTIHSVSEAVNDEPVLPGKVLIAPGDFHMTVRKSGESVRISLNQDELENSCRPAVDPLFRSVAKCYGANSLGVVLTGMGSDGMRGAAVIKSAGGRVIVQDQSSSVVWGMPGQVVQAGDADAILSLDDISKELSQIKRSKTVETGAIAPSLEIVKR